MFSIPVSGIYYVHIAPDLAIGPEFELSTDIKQDYGNLNYIRYLRYTSIRWIMVFSIFIFVALTCFALRFESEIGSQNLSSVQAITKTVVWLILLPFIAISKIELIYLLIRNNYYATYQSLPLLSNLKLILQFSGHFYSAFASYVTLLFSMGFGVVYYYHDNLEHYRKLPSNLYWKANALLTVDMLIILLNIYIHNSYRPFARDGLGLFSISFAILLATLWYFLPVVWFITSVVFMFKTKKSISALATKPNVESASETYSAFKKSIAIIWILPFVIKAFFRVLLFVLIEGFLKPENSDHELSIGELKEQSINWFYFTSASMSIQALKDVWLNWLCNFLTLSLVLLVWGRSNKRLAKLKNH